MADTAFAFSHITASWQSRGIWLNLTTDCPAWQGIGASLSCLRSFRRRYTAARAHLVETDRLAYQTQRELTSLIRELRPASFEDKGLAAALREYLADWSRQNSVMAEMRVLGEQTTSLMLEQTLFRVAQEALANVARHSGATQVQVHLSWERDSVTLTVSDNGQGFEPSALPGKGLGMSSMRERVEAVGGQIDVSGRPGEGTRVWVRCAIR